MKKNVLMFALMLSAGNVLALPDYTLVDPDLITYELRVATAGTIVTATAFVLSQIVARRGGSTLVEDPIVGVGLGGSLITIRALKNCISLLRTVPRY